MKSSTRSKHFMIAVIGIWKVGLLSSADGKSWRNSEFFARGRLFRLARFWCARFRNSFVPGRSMALQKLATIHCAERQSLKTNDLRSERIGKSPWPLSYRLPTTAYVARLVPERRKLGESLAGCGTISRATCSF